MKHLLLCLAQLSLATAAQAVIVQVDYTYDAANGNFFGLNSTARAAVNAAAADLSAVLLPSLGAVTKDVFTGNNNGTTATFDWRLSFTNPATDAKVTLNTFTQAADQVTIYAAMRPLLGTPLGEGGPGGAGFSLQTSGQGSRLAGAVAAAEAESNAMMRRGAGPVMGSLSGTTTLGGTQASYNLQYGAIVGSLWLDSDTNNNGSVDSTAELNAYWHFDHTTQVPAGKFDFYSVALHELMHALGVGTSDTWDLLANGTTWLGPAAQAQNGGSGANLLSNDGAHLRSGYMSRSLIDGSLQEAAIDPSLTSGTRKYLTEMDLALLEDIGYRTIPEPGTAMLLALGVATCCPRRRGRSC
jgi:hypothetical protein